jgi:rubrerythrin
MSDQRRQLAWKLNWWRQSELEGALLLGRMVGHTEDTNLCHRLTRHCAEEAGHSRIWAEVLAELALPHVKICRSYQAFFLDHTSAPRTLVEVLAFTQVFEKRVHRRFHEELRRPDTPLPARRAYEQMIEDEKDHLAWVAAWLAGHAGSLAEMARFTHADREVFTSLAPFEDRLWEIPGLGIETEEAKAV